MIYNFTLPDEPLRQQPRLVVAEVAAIGTLPAITVILLLALIRVVQICLLARIKRDDSSAFDQLDDVKQALKTHEAYSPIHMLDIRPDGVRQELSGEAVDTAKRDRTTA